MKQAIMALALAASVAFPSASAADYRLQPTVHPGLAQPAWRIALLFSMQTGKTIAYIVGGLDTGLAARLQAVLKDHPEVSEIAFNSPGGLFSEGLAVGTIISNHKLTTDVPQNAMCVSACAFAFLGGAKYRVKGVLAFHHPYEFPQQLLKQPIDQIIESASISGAEGVLWCVANGFVYRFAKIIATKTTPDEFFVFTNERQLAGYMNPSRSIDGIFGKSKRFTLFMDGKGLGVLSRMIQKYRSRADEHTYRVVEVWSQQHKGTM